MKSTKTTRSWWKRGPTFSLEFNRTTQISENREFKKDIKFQIDKPTQRETHMKSKTRHGDGDGENL